MIRDARLIPALLASFLFLPACSRMSTNITHLERLTENKGYELRGNIPEVQRAAVEVLRQRGYTVTVKPQPGLGAGDQGVAVIGEKSLVYHADRNDPKAYPAHPAQIGYRDVVTVTVQGKWGHNDDQPVPGVALVNVYGLTYVRNGSETAEQPEPIKVPDLTFIRDEVEKTLAAGPARQPAVGNAPTNPATSGEAQDVTPSGEGGE